MTFFNIKMTIVIILWMMDYNELEGNEDQLKTIAALEVKI